MIDDPDRWRCECGGMFQPVNTGGDPRNPGLACPVCLTWREPDQDYPDAPEHWVRWTLIIYGDRRPRRND